MDGSSTAPMSERPQPDRENVAGSPRLHVVKHALASIQLATLRDIDTDFHSFSFAAQQLASIVLLETCRHLPLEPATVSGFGGKSVIVHHLAGRVAGIAILRAGQIFEPAFRSLLPDAPLYHLGVKRDEAVLEPEVYSSNLPESDDWTDHLIIADPMVATGGTMCKAIELVREHYAGPLKIACLVAAPVGVQRVLEADDDCRIVTAALDERLDANGYIVPGLGDAGDRYFGTTGE